jgi:hypothetical protein
LRMRLLLVRHSSTALGSEGALLPKHVPQISQALHA